MKPLNRDAVAYLIGVAAEAGFELIEMSTNESTHDAPSVRLHLRQTGKLTIQSVGDSKIGPKPKAALDDGDD